MNENHMKTSVTTGEVSLRWAKKADQRAKSSENGPISPNCYLLGLRRRLDYGPRRQKYHENDGNNHLKTVNTRSNGKSRLGMMSELNLAKVEKAQKLGRRIIGGIYKRTRLDDNGKKVQRAEVRFDDVSGCLRTPAGGSSRQLILVVNGEKIRSRLITTRETARLMGLPDSYQLPSNYNEGYHLTGDGVAVPVVRYLAQHVFERILVQDRHDEKIAA